ncbi:MAG: NAD-dependent epimerase/dehydratase family protein [Clostridiales bacterium]|nr:NAD-dependent epimerase/dehydratase family protein [Clostridiales bacterium]
MENKKILVTGATGHIGNVLVRKLTALDMDIRVFVLPGEDLDPIEGLEVEVCTGDVTDYKSVFDAVKGCDFVFHLASMISIEKGKKDILGKVNVGGAKNIVEACLSNDVKRLVYVSSVHALTEPPHGTAFVENTDFEPDKLLGDYAWSKATASIEVKKGVDRGLDTVFAYPSGIVGPYDNRKTNNLINTVRSFLEADKSDTLRYFEGEYDYVDVRDVADGIIKAFQKGESGMSYLFTGEKVTVKQMFETFMKASGKNMKLKRISYRVAYAAAYVAEAFSKLTKKKPSLTTYSVAVLKSNADFDNSFTKMKLGYKSRSFEESIRDTIEWLKK